MYDYDDVPIVNPHRRIWPGLAPTAETQAFDSVLELPEMPGYPACAGTDPELFFPEQGDNYASRMARRICTTCPIMVWCRETHINEQYGIWGATTSRQRQHIRVGRGLPEPQRVTTNDCGNTTHNIGKVKCDMAFQKVEVPAGSYMGWSETKPGQVFEGHVIEYGEMDGTDYAKNPCPLLTVKLTRKATSVNKQNERTTYEPGEELSLTAGQANLKKAVKKAHREFGLTPGTLVRIELDHFEKVPNGRVKVFDVQVDTSTRGTSEAAAAAEDDHEGGGDQGDDEPPF